MSKFSEARTNMVDCQIETAGVSEAKILDSFSDVLREEFVPNGKEHIAYSDKDLMLGEGRFLLSPRTHARMLQAAELKEDDIVLDISNSNGYSAAILSPLVSTVVCVEEDVDMLCKISLHWENLDICNVAGFEGALFEGAKAHAPYDLIFIAGSVAEIPQEIMEQLVPGGRLIAIVRERKDVVGEVTLVKCVKDSQEEKTFSSTVLFEAAAPYLPGFEPDAVFNF